MSRIYQFTTNQMHSGFTLIELLVVIAIIGVLASVVLASLNSSRTKAEDSAIQAQMEELRKQAEVYSLVHGVYSPNDRRDDSINECTNHPNMGNSMFGNGAQDQTVITHVTAVADKTSDITSRVRCAAGRMTWAFAAPLNDPPSGETGWCVDSSGNSTYVNINFNTSGSELGSSNFSCP